MRRYLVIDFSGDQGQWKPNVRKSNVWIATIEKKGDIMGLIKLQRVQQLPGYGRRYVGAVQEQHVDMYIQVQCTVETLDQGLCAGPDAIDNLSITPDRNYFVRFYEPKQPLLGGQWTLPGAKPVALLGRLYCIEDLANLLK